MILEYKGALKNGMIAYVLPNNKRRISEYRDVFSFGPDTYTGRMNMVSKLNQIECSGVVKDSFNLKVHYGSCSDYTYTQADCFIFGHIALHGSNKEEINFIAKLIEMLGNKDIKNWKYDTYIYSLDGLYAGSFEEALNGKGYTVYEVKDFYKFCKNNNIILPVKLNYIDDEIELQRKESPERGGNVSGDVGICVRRYRIEFTLGHLSNKAQSF